MEQQLAPFQKRLRLVLAIRGAGWGFLIGASLTLLLSILDYIFQSQSLQFWPYLLSGCILTGLLVSALRPLPLPLLAATIDHAAGLGAGLTTALELNEKKHAFASALQDSAFMALSKTSPKAVLPAHKPPQLLNALLLLALAVGFCYVPPIDHASNATSLNQNAALTPEQSQKLADAATELRAKSDHEKDLRDIARETQNLARDLENEKLDLQSAFDKLGRLEERLLTLRETDEAQARIREALKDSEILNELKKNIAEKGKESSAPAQRDIQSLKDLAQGDRETENALKQFERAKSPLARRDAAENLLRKLSQIKEQEQKLDANLKQSLEKLESSLREAQKELASNASKDRESTEDSDPNKSDQSPDKKSSATDSETPKTDKTLDEPNKTELNKADPAKTDGSQNKAKNNGENGDSNNDSKSEPKATDPDSKKVDVAADKKDPKTAEAGKDLDDPNSKTADVKSKQNPEDPTDSVPKDGSKTEEPTKPDSTNSDPAQKAAKQDPKKDPAKSDKKQAANSSEDPEKTPKKGQPKKGQPEQDPKTPNPDNPEAETKDDPEENQTKNDAPNENEEPDKKDESPKDNEPSGGLLQDLAVDMAKKVMDMGIEPPTDMLDDLDLMDDPAMQDWAKSMVEKLIDSGFEVPKDFKPPKVPESMKNKEPSPEMKAWQKKIAEKLLKSGFKPPKNMKVPESNGSDKGAGQGEQWQKDFAQKLLDSGFKPSKELMDQAKSSSQMGGSNKGQGSTTNSQSDSSRSNKGASNAKPRGEGKTKGTRNGSGSTSSSTPGSANSKFAGKYYSPKMSVSQDKNGQKKWVFAKDGGRSGAESRDLRIVPGQAKPRSKTQRPSKKAVDYDSISGDSESRGKIPSGYKAYIKRYFEYQKDAKKK
ncbi:MAG: hypothetical protein P1V97_01170 [Planctomycetota bacterium]|nr:hypothetical protein [Planctomycetota bacterium]